MSRRDEHLDALLKHLGATYYQTLHGDAAAWDVARAVASVEAEETARRPGESPVPPRGQHGRTGQWRVRDVMRTDPVTVDRGTPAKEIARRMSEHRVSAVPVIASAGRLLGVVSEADLLGSRDEARSRSMVVRSWPSRWSARGTGTLAARDVARHAGTVLLALTADDAVTAVDVITGLGLDCQVIRNRGAAMILLAGVTKAARLLAALAELGLSAHNTIAVGDAENDLSLLQAAEAGAAVANAVPSLAAHADLRLASRNGVGVAELLTGRSGPAGRGCARRRNPPTCAACLQPPTPGGRPTARKNHIAPPSVPVRWEAQRRLVHWGSVSRQSASQAASRRRPSAPWASRPAQSSREPRPMGASTAASTTWARTWEG